MSVHRRRTALVLGVIAALVAPVAAADGAPKQTLGFLHAVRNAPDGGRLVDNAGRPFEFRGVNVQGNLNAPAYMWGGPLSPETSMYRNLESVVGPAEVDAFRQEMYRRWITEKDMARIAALGFNSVRVPIEAQDLDHYTGAWETLDRIVAWGEKYHVYVMPSPTELRTCVPDEFPFSDWSPGRPLLWDPHCDLAGVIDVWQAIATRYRDSHWIAGWDIANEPMSAVGNRDAVRTVQQRIIESIRTVDPNHLVIAEGDFFATDFGPFGYGTAGQGASYVNGGQTIEPIADNLAYMFHSYNLRGDQVNAQDNIDGFNTIARSQGVPFFNGEFGANTNEWVAGTRQILEDPANLVHGWMFWTWKDVYRGDTTHFVREIDASPTWMKVIGWAGGLHEVGGPGDPTRTPTPDEVRRGFAEFLDAMRLADTFENPDVLAALGMGRGARTPSPPLSPPVNCSAAAGQSCVFASDGSAVQGWISSAGPGTTISVTDLTDPTQAPFTGDGPGVVLQPYLTGHTYRLDVGPGTGTVYAGSVT